MDWAIVHILSLVRSVGRCFTWLQDKNLLYGGIKGIVRLGSNEEVPQFKMHYYKCTSDGLVHVNRLNKPVININAKRYGTIVIFEGIQLLLEISRHQPMFCLMMTCSVALDEEA